MSTLHYTLNPQARTQLDGRWHGEPAPLCATGDGHWIGVNPDEWKGQHPRITCPRCIERLEDPFIFRALGRPSLGKGVLSVLSLK